MQNVFKFPSVHETETREQQHILVVEDDLVVLGFIEAVLEDLDIRVSTATDGKKALDLLEKSGDTIDAVVLDREMPALDGMTVVGRMKQNNVLRRVPVVMVTGADSEDDVRDGLDAGVFYYLTKPIEPGRLKPVLNAALRESGRTRTLAKELQQHRTGFSLIDTCRFKFSTLTEATTLAAFIANCFPEAERVLPGLGELLINAIEHGNLGIGLEAKARLIAEGDFLAEVDRRAALEENRDKVASATLTKRSNSLFVIIEDQGEGFDWKPYLNIDLSRSSEINGRGIALARAKSFDTVTFNDTGNKVVASVSLREHLEW